MRLSLTAAICCLGVAAISGRADAQPIAKFASAAAVCSACHGFAPSQPAKLEPNLWGLAG